MNELLTQVEEFKRQGFNKICFWQPAYNIGGGTYLMCQVAKYLSVNTDLDVYFLDFPNGYPTQMLMGSDVQIIDYYEGETEFAIKEPCVVFTNSTRVVQLQHMNPKNKLLFWHYETVRCGWDSVLVRYETKDFLELTKEKNAMIFHDWSSRNIFLRQYGIDYQNQSYLSVFLPPKKKILRKFDMISNDEIHIVWIGRISNDKRYSIYNVIDNYVKYKTKRKKFFHIVGDGWKLDELKEYAAKYGKGIRFDFRGSIPKDKLDDFLFTHADVVFAMGLSAIEGAAMQIPSAVVQIDLKPIRDNQFYWLFDTKEYCVGILNEQKEDFDIHYSTFNEMMDDLCYRGQKKEIAKQCYKFYQENFSDFDDVVARFMQYVNDSSMTAADLEKCITYMPYTLINVTQKKLFKWIVSETVDFVDRRDYYKNGVLKRTEPLVIPPKEEGDE